MKNQIIFPLTILILLTACKADNTGIMDLSGTWQFSVDSQNIGIGKIWSLWDFKDSITLPNSSYNNGILWYQKEIRIPENWRGRYIELYLERCYWETRVWVDGHAAGMQNSMCTPHRYDLSPWLNPGYHRICLYADNRFRETQTRDDEQMQEWNRQNYGISGKIELRTFPVAGITNVQAIAENNKNEVKVTLTLRNYSGKNVKAKITITGGLSGRTAGQPKTEDIVIGTGVEVLETIYPLKDNLQFWDVENPNLYILNVELKSIHYPAETRSIYFGIRKISDTRQMTLYKSKNPFPDKTRIVFANDSICPGCDEDSWASTFSEFKNKGKVMVFFKRRCPPEAAFIAADKKGIYIGINVPHPDYTGLGLFNAPQRLQYITDETTRIMAEYGNHPSLYLFTQ